MTIRELDRLVSKTELTPVSKQALRAVRQAVITGRCGDAERGKGVWSIAVDNGSGSMMRMSFSFKRDDNGS